MKLIVDTNVPIVANKAAPQASEACVLACIARLKDIAPPKDIESQHILVLDDDWHILGEYQRKLRSEGQSGAGDDFLKWVLINRSNPDRCEQVHITPCQDDSEEQCFREFPSDPELANFDRSDRKFVATALAHRDHPPILNAVDPDWRQYQSALERHRVRIEFLCADV